ncbi:hypothetical protein [Streptomyces sp. NPDC002746]
MTTAPNTSHRPRDGDAWLVLAAHSHVNGLAPELRGRCVREHLGWTSRSSNVC